MLVSNVVSRLVFSYSGLLAFCRDFFLLNLCVTYKPYVMVLNWFCFFILYKFLNSGLGFRDGRFCTRLDIHNCSF